MEPKGRWARGALVALTAGALALGASTLGASRAAAADPATGDKPAPAKPVKPPKPAKPAGTEAAKPAKPGAGAEAAQPIRSPLAGITFTDRPLPLGDDGTFGEFLNAAATDLNRTCGAKEFYGWEISPDDQKRVDRLHDGVLSGLRAHGYVTNQTKLKTVQSDDVITYAAGKADRNLLLIWSLSPASRPGQMAQMVLLLCDATKAR
jgi:hypothetical protein